MRRNGIQMGDVDPENVFKEAAKDALSSKIWTIFSSTDEDVGKEIKEGKRSYSIESGKDIKKRFERAEGGEREKERKIFDELVFLNLDNKEDIKKWDTIFSSNKDFLPLGRYNDRKKIQQAYRDRFDLIQLSSGKPQIFNQFRGSKTYSPFANKLGRVSYEHTDPKVRSAFELNAVLAGTKATEENLWDEKGRAGTLGSSLNDPHALSNRTTFARVDENRTAHSEPWDFEVNDATSKLSYLGKNWGLDRLSKDVPHIYYIGDKREIKKYNNNTRSNYRMKESPVRFEPKSKYKDKWF